MTPVDFHSDAADEVAAAEAWLAARSVPAARRFKAELSTAVRRISCEPSSFPKHDRPGFRHAPLMKSGYAVIYRERAGRVVVVAVAHGRQRPGYWADRL